MGLESAYYDDAGSLDEDGGYQLPKKKQDFGDSEEEQRKGLWRSIFGYFRGPKKAGQQLLQNHEESKSLKASSGAQPATQFTPEQSAARQEEVVKQDQEQIEREFGLNPDDIESVGYDSENSNNHRGE